MLIFNQHHLLQNPLSAKPQVLHSKLCQFKIIRKSNHLRKSSPNLANPPPSHISQLLSLWFLGNQILNFIQHHWATHLTRCSVQLFMNKLVPYLVLK